MSNNTLSPECIKLSLSMGNQDLLLSSSLAKDALDQHPDQWKDEAMADTVLLLCEVSSIVSRMNISSDTHTIPLSFAHE